MLRGFAFASCLIPFSGMENTLLEGERILVNKWSYGLRVPLTALFGYHRWAEKKVNERDVVVFNNPVPPHPIAVDRREVYISRCIGLPGDTLWIDTRFTTVTTSPQQDTGETLYPVIIPGKGKTLQVYPWNITLIRNTLVLHEGRKAEIRNRTLYIDGKPAEQCTFTKDYYWMQSDNAQNFSDSRLFGLVPSDHLIGKATFVWFSKERNTGLFDGYRWKRFFRAVQ